MHIFHFCGHIYPFLDGCKKSFIAEIEDIMQKEWIIYIPNTIQRWNFFSTALISSFFDIFKVFSIFLFYIFHVTFPLFSISPGICSFPVFFNAFQNAFKIFSILFLDNFIFLFLDIVKIFLWHMFLPLLFSMLSKYFQCFFFFRKFHFHFSR